MKKVLFLLFLLLFSNIPFLHADEPNLRAGVAMADISPPVGVPLAGYGGGKRRLEFPDLDPDNYHVLLTPSEGVLDPLISKVLVLESKGVKVLIIKLDSIGVTQNMVDDLAKRIASTGISRDNITVTGTHTHSGPGAMAHDPFWAIAAADLFDARIYEPFLDKLAGLVIEADKKLKPARLGISTALNFQLTRNRRNHPGVFDPMIGVFRIEDTNGTPMAILFNFAIHGTCYGDDNLKMSGDVMGFAERQIEKVMMEQKTPVVAMFINGTEGDVSPSQGKGEGAVIVGESLGKHVLNIAANVAMREDVTIGVANEEISFEKAHLNLDLFEEARNRNFGEVDCWGIRNLLSEHAPDAMFKIKIEITGLVPSKFRLQTLRIGNSVIACVPGEALTAIGVALKANGAKLGFRNTFVFGLANGHMGYICDEENFDEGGYEAMLTIYGRSQGQKMIDAYTRMFEKLAKE